MSTILRSSLGLFLILGLFSSSHGQKLYNTIDKSNYKKAHEILASSSIREVNETTKWGQNALMLCLDRANYIKSFNPVGSGKLLRLAEKIIYKGADINRVDNQGSDAILRAMNYQQMEIVQLLLERGVIIEPKPEYLIAACKSGQLEVVEKLLAKGLDVNTGDKEGFQAIHRAAGSGDERTVTFLLEKGANPNARVVGALSREQDLYLTPLHLAAQASNSRVITALLEKGAEVNAKGAGNVRPLHFAAMGNSLSNIQVLVANGAEVNVKAEDGYTPLHLAALNNNKSMVAFLLENEAEVIPNEDSGEDAFATAACLLTQAEVDNESDLDETKLSLRNASRYFDSSAMLFAKEKKKAAANYWATFLINAGAVVATNAIISNNINSNFEDPNSFSAIVSKSAQISSFDFAETGPYKDVKDYYKKQSENSYQQAERCRRILGCISVSGDRESCFF